MVKIIWSSVVSLPSPNSLSVMWNFGSLLGLCLVIQLISGIFLSMHYTCSIETAFESLSHIMRDVNLGWMLRIIHANGASFFFLFTYFHIGRGLYYGSFMLTHVWLIGVTLLLTLMATAFLGYVLPWGQMSFWGATVITNLFSAIPYIGLEIVTWLWGGFSVSQATITRFFSFHFILPFLIAGLTMIHLLFLHETGSSNPLGLNTNLDKITFNPYFTSKDLMGFFIFLMIFLSVVFYAPWYLGDVENFVPANPLVTPIHIQPEWYFLFAYAILRSIPNKLGGVIALLLSVAILYMMPILKFNYFKACNFSFFGKCLFWMLVVNIILLTWIGARPVEEPYILIGQMLTASYFFYYLLLPVVWNLEKKMFI